MTLALTSAGTTNWNSSKPRYATPRDPARPTLGIDTVAHLARLRGAPAYPWQWDVADVAGELNDDGTGWRYSTIVLSVPRRAGKSTLVLAANLAACDLQPAARCWYTCANGREVAAKLFRDEWQPMVAPLSRLYRVRKSQGSEGIHKRRGSSRLQLFAPTPTALHSTNVDTATVDEAFAASIEDGEGIESGITPAQLTRPWRQTWIVSAGGTLESTWWDRWLTAGAAGTPGVALFDYGADPTDPGYDPADPTVWAAAHPTAGVAFPLAVLEHLWATRTDDAAFERAYLNVWPRPSEALVAAGLDLAVWSAAARPAVAPTVQALALDVAADRSSASLAVAGPHAGNPTAIAVEVIDVCKVHELAAAVRRARQTYPRVPVVADSLVAASVVAELRRARVTVDPIGAGDHARGCGVFVDRLTAGTLTHRAQAVLDDAIAGAARRPLGDAWLWSRRHSAVDISPLVAVTLAAWAAATRRPAGKAAVVAPSDDPDPIGRTRHPTRPPIAALRGTQPRVR